MNRLGQDFFTKTMARITGKYEHTSVGGEEVAAFVPHPLPPSGPPLALDANATELLRGAEHGLTRLDLAGEMVPSIEWFLYAFVRKEAVLSSQIEGTQASLVDLLRVEAGASPEGATEEDVEEVSNHLAALAHARSQISRKGGLPLSIRLLNQAHRRLLKGVRGADKRPGEIRRSQNWIGGTRPGNATFVPPPPREVSRLLGDLERYVHQTDPLHPLVRAALVHAQFETIHPYLDGNGRIGRLLVALLLEHWRLLSRPLLYLSLFFKQRRGEYYDRLSRVRTDGDWEGWTAFFLEGVATTAEEAVRDARSLFALVAQDRGRLIGSAGVSVSTLRLFEKLPRHPVVTLASVVRLLATTKPTAASAIAGLEKAGILSETTGRQRDRVFAYASYLKRLRSGTDLAK
jgi:Fic family protein